MTSLLAAGGIGLASAAAKQVFGKGPKPIVPTPAATRDDAAAETARDDALRRRRGSAANILVGDPMGGGGSAVTAKALTGE